MSSDKPTSNATTAPPASSDIERHLGSPTPLASDDAFVSELEGDLELDALLADLAEHVAPARLPVDGLSRLLGDAADDTRLARFAPSIATMIDVSVEQATALLAQLTSDAPWDALDVPNTEARWVDGGPNAQNAIRGFVRVHAGHHFPVHSHLGEETTLILQGRVRFDDGRELGPGEMLTMVAGASHSFEALPGGTDLLYFVVAREGVVLGGEEIRHRDA